MRKNKLMLILIPTVMVLFMLFGQLPAFADSYTSADTSIIIDTAPAVSLQASVEAALLAEGSGHTISDITHLTITSDVSYALTAADIAFVQTLPAMTHLFVADTVTVAGGSVGDNFFSFNLVIEDITFPMETIGNESFLTCMSLHTINLPKCTSIGNYVFLSCTALKNVSLPECLSCGNYAFADTNILETLTLPKMETAGEHFCYSSSSLKNISMPNALTFGSDAFKYTYLTNVNLPKAYSFGDYAFYSSYSLETIYLPSAKTFGDVAFNGCANLVAVDMPEIISVGNSCFAYCPTLTSLYLPKATSIGSSLFEGNAKPLSFYAPDAVPSVTAPLFSGFSQLGTSCLMVDRDSFIAYDSDPNDTTGAAGDSKWFGMPICIKNPITPSPVPTAAPTAVPTATPRRTRSATHTPEPTPTPEPTATPKIIEDVSTTSSSMPTVTIAAATPTPVKIEVPAQITPLDDGTVRITIDINGLPEGTEWIVLPNGETVAVAMAENGMLTFIMDGSLLNGGSVTLIAIDDEQVALGAYKLTPSSPEERGRIIPLWVWSLAAIIAIVWGTIFISRKKLPAGGSKYRRR